MGILLLEQDDYENDDDYNYVALHKEVIRKQLENINNIFKKLSNKDKSNDELTFLTVDVYVANSGKIPDQSIENISGKKR